MKISHFPDPLPDETVYSVASRYMDRMQFLSHSVVSQHFFGGRSRGLVTDLPSCLEHLMQSLPYKHRYTVDMVIDQHTLFPFYAPFLSFERALTLRQYMKNDKHFVIPAMAGISSSKVLRPQWLKYCPECVNYDRLTYGECYWHRIHQVPGVLVCPMHEIMLEDSTINLLRRNNVPKFSSAESTVINSPQRVAPFHLHAALVQLAQNAKWLLECWTPIEQWSMKQEYIQHLDSRRLVTAAGIVRYTKLKAAISDYYPADLLEILGCSIAKSKGIWFQDWTEIQHPLHHLLLIQFLCKTAQGFFTKSQSSSVPFGNGPWPCLNPLCSHYKDRVIISYTVKQGKLNQPTATFACHCGFTYTRTGPDKDDSDIFRGRALQYGTVWDQHLTTYWLDQNIPTGRIARLMHTNNAAIRRQAARLNLPFAPDIPRRGKRPMIKQDYINEKRVTYYALWETALKSNPHGALCNVINAAPKAYSWLKRHDRDWLKEHYPILIHSSNNERQLIRITHMQQIYYSQIDADLAESVRRTAEKIYAKSDFPIQVTRRTLVAQVGNAALTKSADVLDNLPMTSQALKEGIDTEAAFIWRKLRWTVQSFLAEPIHPTFYLFLIHARINSLTSKHPIYKPLIQFAYNSLYARTLLQEQIPEDLIKRFATTSSDMGNIREVVSGSLASIFIEKQPILFKVSNTQKIKKYNSISLILLLVSAVVNGAENFNAVARWGYNNEELLIKFGLPEGHFPPPATIKRCCAQVNIDCFESILEAWLRDRFTSFHNITNIMEDHDRSTYVPGLRVLQPYRSIDSDVIAKLY